jgi:hypothetical protein
MTNADPNDQRDRTLEGIARRALGIPTLRTRRSDRLDFREVAVWSLLEALRLAYAAGYERAVADRERPPAGICPRCGEDDHDRLVWDELGETVTCQQCGTKYTVHPID